MWGAKLRARLPALRPTPREQGERFPLHPYMACGVMKRFALDLVMNGGCGWMELFGALRPAPLGGSGRIFTGLCDLRPMG